MIYYLCYYYLYIFANLNILNNRIIPKYQVWPLTLNNIRCPFVKTSVIPFLTLVFNAEIIIGIIDLLQTFAK